MGRGGADSILFGDAPAPSAQAREQRRPAALEPIDPWAWA
jgi:hypothetical protein